MEAPQAYLLKLVDALGLLTGPDEIKAAAAEMLARRLRVAAAGYIEVSPDLGMIPAAGGYSLSDFGESAQAVLAGEELYAEDCASIGAAACIPLMNAGRLAAFLYAVDPHPRHWPEEDRFLLRETAERTRRAVERARAESELRAGEERRRRLFQAIDEGFCVAEFVRDESGRPVDFRHLECNAAFERLIGCGPVVGRLASELAPQDCEFWVRACASMVDAGAGRKRVVHHVAQTDRWYEAAAFPFGGGGRFAVLLSDVTERKRTEAALLESEERFRHLVESYAHAVWETNAEGVVVADSPSWRAFTGQTYEEWIGYGWLNAIHPGDRACAERQWREAVAQRRDVNMEFRLKTANGDWQWTNVRATPIYAADGSLVKWAGINVNIHRRKRAEESLRESEARQSFLVRLSDALQPLTDPVAVPAAAARALAEHLGAGRCYYAEVESETFPALARLWQAAGIPGLMAALAEGKPAVAESCGETDAAPAGIHSCAVVPLIKQGRLAAALGVAQSAPRQWTPGEVSLIGEVAERTWEAVKRARGEEALRESEARYRALAGATSEALFRMNPDWSEMRQLSGGEFLTGAETPSRDWLQSYIPPEDRHLLRAAVAEAIRTKGAFELEHRVRRKDGSLGWAFSRAVPRLDAEGGILEWFGAASDITKRKQVELDLKESRNKYQALIETTSDFIWEVDSQGRYTYCSPQAETLWGIKPEEMIGKTPFDVMPPEQKASATAAFANMAKSPQPFSGLESEAYDGQGRLIHIETSAVPFFDDRGTLLGFRGISRDITERKRAQEALGRSERLYRAIGESIDYGVWVCDPDGRNTYASESFLKLVGQTQEQCSNFGWGDVLHPDDAEKTIAAWKECVRTGGRWDIEHRYRGVDGKWHDILARGVPVRDERGEVVCWAGINLDISALKRAQEELRRSNAVLEAFFAASPGILNIDDEELRYVKTDALTPTYFGLTRESIVGKSIAELAPEFMREYGAMLREVIETGQPRLNVEVRTPVADRGGEMAYWLASYFPVPLPENRRGVGVVGVEITELRKAEERLRQAQKLESLGVLAGGVAHDFNNLLVGIVGCGSLAEEMLPAGHPAVELIQTVIRTGEQAAHLTRQMLAYSGKGTFVLEPLDLSAIIPEMAGLIRSSISKNIALHLNLGPALPFIEADRGQVQQVFMNLVLNAAEAIGGRDGVITVVTGVRAVDGSFIRLNPEAADLRPGEYVLLQVHDTGCGMDETTRARIFDPFFTTKFTGRGLGLAAVAGIVRGHKGCILVKSAPGQGSAFTVLFPRAAAPAGRAAVPAPRLSLRGSGVILVVDDEALVREMAKRALERHGYTVLAADSGPAAIDLFRTRSEEIALIVLDLSMPKLSGEQTLPHLRKIRPEVKVIISSGYSEAETMLLFKDDPISGFIQKPYTATTIAEKVKLALT